jgi:[protein-PII] uridylyltransferase
MARSLAASHRAMLAPQETERTCMTSEIVTAEAEPTDFVAVAPEIDPSEFRRVLTAIFKRHGDADAARPDIVTLLKAMHAESHRYAEAQLLATGDGRACAKYLSDTMDDLVSGAFDYASAHVYHRSSGAEGDRMAVVATGGYGRGLMAPGSDVDLLFLLPYKQTPWAESVAEYMLYLLWDVGMKVGHATRNVDQCIKLSSGDVTIRSALLDARLIHGAGDLFDEFKERFAKDVTRASARNFVEAKMAERDRRHDKSGNSRFLVEPNIKDGKGGLRDLHTLHWLSVYLTGYAPGAKAVAEGILNPSEMATFRRCEDFLWTVRCHLHFLTGRAEERLSFDVQPDMARRLKYRDTEGLSAVERFMKHYFIIAKDVGDLTRTLSTALEMEQLKDVPSLSVLNPATWATRRRVRTISDFKIENDRINIIDDKVFERDPINLLRVFRIVSETGALLHPNMVRRMRLSLRLIDDDFRKSSEASELFLTLLTSSASPEDMFRRMHATGVLGRFMPEFATVTAMMQFNMYHHYTVDEHLLRTIGEVHAIERGLTKDELPLATDIINEVKDRRVLYVAALIHDIGKGQPEDHSVLGARLARTICTRLGMSARDVELVVWLVREHLTMSLIAQNRDLSDPRTISDFAQTVGSLERLRLLLILTVADIRAVGPGTWNGWKGSLLRQLYFETANQLADFEVPKPPRDQIAEAQDEFRNAVPAEWGAAATDAIVARHYDDYWLKTDLESQIAHAELLRELAASDVKFATTFTSDAFTEMTELRVVAPNHPRLLSLFAGCCAAAGANIISAQINTTRDGLVLDDFTLERGFDDQIDEDRRSRRITETIEKVLNGKARLKELLDQQTRPSSRVRAFRVKPEVSIDNTISDNFTVIDVAGRDRPGLLYDLTSALSDLSVDINTARITTFGERAVDAFYVTDLTSKKIIDPARKDAITKRLIDVLSVRG